MKKTKRLLAVTLSVAMIIGMAAGCGKKSDSSSKDEKGKTLEVWLPPLSENQDDKDVWDRILDPFEEENNCTVNVFINFYIKCFFSFGKFIPFCNCFNYFRHFLIIDLLK